MKRILVLNYEFPPLGGGASPVSYELAKRLSETGDFDIDVVTMGYKNLSKYEEVNKNFRIYRVKCWRSRKEICHPWEQATYLVSGWVKCKELLKNNNYDICHTHFIIPTGVIALRLKKKFGLSYVITSHGSDVPGFNTDRFQLLHKFTGPLLRAVTSGAETIVSPSNYLRELIIRNISSKLTDKTIVIPNGIDTNKFIPQPKKNWIFSSGRLLPRKGFQYLIQAVSNEDIGYEVHIAGDGPMISELKKLAEKSKTKIIFHGWLDNNGKEYKDLLEQSAIFVLASEKENASIALLEAMSAGCAVITTNISGCPETVGDAGLLVNPRDTADLKLKLGGIINNQNQLTELQKLAIKRVESIYDWVIILKEYKRILIKEKQDNKIVIQNGEIGNIQSSLDYFLKFNIPKDAKILDIGCNYGSLIFNLYSLGYKNVFGIEIDKDSIEKGKIFYPEISNNLITHKAGIIPFETGVFDIVLMFDVIEHVPDIDNFLKNEVHRVIKKDGIFIFQTPNKPMNIIWVYIDNLSFNVKWWEEHCSLQTIWSLRKLLKKSGFHNIVIEKFNIYTNHNKNKVIKKLGIFGLLLLKWVSLLPIFLQTNLWGYAKNEK